jgi:hypothetical protein
MEGPESPKTRDSGLGSVLIKGKLSSHNNQYVTKHRDIFTIPCVLTHVNIRLRGSVSV